MKLSAEFKDSGDTVTITVTVSKSHVDELRAARHNYAAGLLAFELAIAAVAKSAESPRDQAKVAELKDAHGRLSSIKSEYFDELFCHDLVELLSVAKTC